MQIPLILFLICPPSLGVDLGNTYTWGNHTLYTDIPEMVPIHNLSAHHHYLGPLFWSAHLPLPKWWDHLSDDKSVVFLTSGSSGLAKILPKALIPLSQFPITVIVATAGKIVFADRPPNAYFADYIPIEIAIRRAHTC